MEKYINEGTTKFPTIEFDLKTGVLNINGYSIPEDPIGFYAPLLEAVETYSNKMAPTTVVNIRLEYFNTGSSKWLLEVFKKFEAVHNGGSPVVINWEYVAEDEDMLEAGKDYQDIVNVPFQVIEVEEKD